MNAWLVLTHTLTLVVGVASGVLFVRARPVREAITHEEHDVTDTPKPAHRVRLAQVVHGRGPTPGALALFLILSGVMFSAFGIQQGAYQAADREEKACTAEWGRSVTDVLDKRFGAAERLEVASSRRDEALDAILLLIAAFQENPPPQAESDRRFRAAILAFVDAKLHKDEVEARVAATRESNPYPSLDCASDIGLLDWLWDTVTP